MARKGQKAVQKSWGKMTLIFIITWSFELTARSWGPFSALTPQILPHSLMWGSLSTPQRPRGSEMVPDTASGGAAVQSLGMGINFPNWNPGQLCELWQGIQPLCTHFSIREMGTIFLLPL